MHTGCGDVCEFYGIIEYRPSFGGAEFERTQKKPEVEADDYTFLLCP